MLSGKLSCVVKIMKIVEFLWLCDRNLPAALMIRWLENMRGKQMMDALCQETMEKMN